MKLYTLLNIAFLCCVKNALVAQEINPDTFKSKIASKAVREYLNRGEKATENFLKEKQEATEELVDELEQVLKKTTSDGDLEEAIKIKSSIEALKKDANTSPSDVESRFLGRWKIRYPNSGIYYNDFVKSGTTMKVNRWIDPDKKLETRPDFQIINDETWVIWKNGERRERVQILPDGRLFIEHFYVKPGKAMSEFPDQYAVGEKIK